MFLTTSQGILRQYYIYVLKITRVAHEDRALNWTGRMCRRSSTWPTPSVLCISFFVIGKLRAILFLYFEKSCLLNHRALPRCAENYLVLTNASARRWSYNPNLRKAKSLIEKYSLQRSLSPSQVATSGALHVRHLLQPESFLFFCRFVYSKHFIF